MGTRLEIFEQLQDATAGEPIDLVCGAALDFLGLVVIEASQSRAHALALLDRWYPLVRAGVDAKWSEVRADLRIADQAEGSA